MEYRAELPDDRQAVLDVNRRAFGDSGDKVAALVNGLRHDDPEAPSLVATNAGRVVGHVMFTRTLLDAPRRLMSVAVLSPLAVDPQWQRRGIGSALVRYGVETLDRSGAPMVWLEGSPAYYGRFGFKPGGDHGFRKPSLRIPDAAFQVLTLSAYEPWMTGTLVYSATFWKHDCVGLRDPNA
jgi:putative acetyltransferase